MSWPLGGSDTGTVPFTRATLPDATKLAAFGSSPEQMTNSELKGSVLFFAFHGHTEHNLTSVPWKSLGGIRAIRGKHNCALGQSRSRWGRGNTVVSGSKAPGCSLLGLPFPHHRSAACQGSWHIPAPRLAPSWAALHRQQVAWQQLAGNNPQHT